MDGYQLAETRGRKRVQSDFGKALILLFTQGKFDGVDFYATAITCTTTTYVGEIKNYMDSKYPRSLRKFKDYMIDWGKLNNMKAIAESEGRIPILVVYFTDYTVIWDLRNIDIDSRRKWRWVNKDGQEYGKEKELALMTFLYENEALWKREVREVVVS